MIIYHPPLFVIKHHQNTELLQISELTI